MTTNITDWVVKVGWDASAVDRGHRRLNTMFTRLNTSLGRMESARTLEMRKQTAELRKQQQIAGTALAKRPGMGGLAFPGLERLDVKRFRKETSIAKAEERGNRLLSMLPQGDDPRLKRMREQIQMTVSRLGALRQGLTTAVNASDFAKIDRSLGRLNTTLGRSSAEVGKLNRQMTMADRFSMRMRGSMVNLAVSLASVFAVIRGGQAFFRIGSEMESLQASMLAASGSSEAAANDFKFVTNAALRLGVDLQEATHGYTQLGAAARAAGFSQEDTKNVFLAVTESARAYGLTAERTNLVFLGFQQMISKGKISMEELRRQIGEQIPGAFSIAAKAMGVTTGELDRMVSKGELMPEQFIVPFANALRQAVRQSGALAAAMQKVIANKERFVSMLKLATKEGFNFSASGFSDSFAMLAVLVKENAPLFKLFGAVFASAFRAIVEVLSVLSAIINVVVKPLGELFDTLERATDIQIAGEKLGWFAKVLRVAAIAALDLQIAWQELVKSLKDDSDFEFLKKLSGFNLSTPFRAMVSAYQDVSSGGTGALASRSAQAAAIEGANKQTIINDYSTPQFNISGPPEQMRRELDSWWQDRLIFSAGQ